MSHMSHMSHSYLIVPGGVYHLISHMSHMSLLGVKSLIRKGEGVRLYTYIWEYGTSRECIRARAGGLRVLHVPADRGKIGLANVLVIDDNVMQAGRPGWRKLETTLLSVSVFELKRRGLLRRDATTTMVWSTGVKLVVRGGLGEVKLGAHRIRVAYTPCNYGGERPWLRCPVCMERRARLFLDGKWKCRECVSVSYLSERDKVGNSVIQLAKLDERLSQGRKRYLERRLQSRRAKVVQRLWRMR